MSPVWDIHNQNPRQIPYAIGQFTVNELCHEVVYRSMSEETKRNLSGTSQLSIALGSGVIAGFAAAVLSQVSPFVDKVVNTRCSFSSAGRYIIEPDQQRPRTQRDHGVSSHRPCTGSGIQRALCRPWPSYDNDCWSCLVSILDVWRDQKWFVVFDLCISSVSDSPV